MWAPAKHLYLTFFKKNRFCFSTFLHKINPFQVTYESTLIDMSRHGSEVKTHLKYSDVKNDHVRGLWKKHFDDLDTGGFDVWSVVWTGAPRCHPRFHFTSLWFRFTPLLSFILWFLWFILIHTKGHSEKSQATSYINRHLIKRSFFISFLNDDSSQKEPNKQKETRRFTNIYIEFQASLTLLYLFVRK